MSAIKVSFKRTSRLIFFSATIFVGAGIIGVLLYSPLSINQNIQQSRFSELYSPKNITNLSTLDILRQNFITCAATMMGALFLGAPTIYLLFINGIIFSHTMCYASTKLATIDVFLLTFPHVTFEFLGLWFAGAIGFIIPRDVLAYLFKKRDRIIPIDTLIDVLLLFIFSFIFLGIAALIEANISIPLAKSIRGV